MGQVKREKTYTPKPMHVAVLYALAEQRYGTVARLLDLEYSLVTGWRVCPPR